jgi:hydroxymethylpyrimidine/phosphomethylpyrimidine kinase
MNVVITIAGSDSGGGAGIQADLKTFEAHGVFGTTAITSITVQNTMGVRAVFDLPPAIVRGELDAVFDDFPVAAVKIGMLSSPAIIELVNAFLEERAAGVPVVVDPVMVATSGDRLLREEAVETIRQRLAPLATLMTPNVAEAAILAGMEVADHDDMRRAAAVIHRLGAAAVLVKGGDLPSGVDDGDAGMATDILYDGRHYRSFAAPMLVTTSTHGTGCTLSSAIAANLARGMSLDDAVERGKWYVHGAIANAPGLGHGHGPLLHAWRKG